MSSLTAAVISELTDRKLTIAVAESLTGGLLVAELIRPAGASAAVLGGVVAYNTELKHSLLGVDAALLAEHGAVHPEVARQLAAGVRSRLAVGGRAADIGIATTGVAGPDPQDGVAPGTVYLGLSEGDVTLARELRATGTRLEIREQTVAAAIAWLAESLERGLG
ncbi:MAG TPA: nicotinamide-nucleotide amidohydrolase family protein [Terrimesophilobacter sp.]|jgi:competence/damage-inducible protein CinA C-terminal domain|uniref:CinA family protein n=1 Tax=Terrimesophilobacter sp. TaxID=2906435 RepID=UPI002F95E0F1